MKGDYTIIIEMDSKKLQLKCVDLLSLTMVELGQTMDTETIVVLSKSLADDLRMYYPSFTLNDVFVAFHKGVRDTDLFHLQVKTFHIWLKERKRILINFEYDTYRKQLDFYQEKRKERYLLNGQKKTKELTSTQKRVGQMVQSLHKEKKFK